MSAPVRKQARTFTLTLSNSLAVDDLADDPSTVKTTNLLRLTQNTLPSLDDNGLTREDYEEFYTLLPPHTPRSDLPRTPDGRLFCLHLDLCYNSNSHGMDRVLRAMNKRIRERKAMVRQREKLNSSLVADMLITLGLATLEKEGASAGEVGVERSARSDAKESGNQLPVTAGRKGVTV